MFSSNNEIFIKTSELYLKLTEKNRSATNIAEIDTLIFLELPLIREDDVKQMPGRYLA